MNDGKPPEDEEKTLEDDYQKVENFDPLEYKYQDKKDERNHLENRLNWTLKVLIVILFTFFVAVVVDIFIDSNSKTVDAFTKSILPIFTLVLGYIIKDKEAS